MFTLYEAMDLLVAVWMQKHQIGEIVHAALSLWKDVMDVPSRRLRDWLVAVWTSTVLYPPKVQQASSPLETALHEQA